MTQWKVGEQFKMPAGFEPVYMEMLMSVEQAVTARRGFDIRCQRQSQAQARALLLPCATGGGRPGSSVSPFMNVKMSR